MHNEADCKCGQEKAEEHSERCFDLAVDLATPHRYIDSIAYDIRRAAIPELFYWTLLALALFH